MGDLKMLKEALDKDPTSASCWKESERSFNTPLLIAASQKDRNAVQLLLLRGADPTKKGKDGTGVLHLIAQIWASYEETYELMKLCIDKGADPNACDAIGQTSLHCAVSSGYYMDAIRVLLALGANPRLRDKQGKTPLERAWAANSLRVVSLLEEALRNEEEEKKKEQDEALHLVC